MLEVSETPPEGYERAESAAQPNETDLSGEAVDEAPATHDTPPAEKHASPVDPVSTTGEGPAAVKPKPTTKAKK